MGERRENPRERLKLDRLKKSPSFFLKKEDLL